MFGAIIFGFILLVPNILIAELEKTWYLDSFCYARCLSEEMQELANQLHDTCVAETGTSNDDILNARKGVFNEDEKFKCYIKCLLSQMAIIDDDGEIDVEAMVAVLPEEYQEQNAPVIRKCGTQKGVNVCDNAWLTHKCYYKESPEALSDEMKELAEMLHNTCVEETGCPEDLIEKVNSDKIFADDERLKCYIKCLMAQMACIDDDGHIDEEATIAVLPEEMQEEASPVIRACGTKVGSNPCENAWLTHKCYAEMKPNYSAAVVVAKQPPIIVEELQRGHIC